VRSILHTQQSSSVANKVFIIFLVTARIKQNS
jgi:hypothetical protein